MECKFFVGQKVVCVDDARVPIPGVPAPVIGVVYTVREILPDVRLSAGGRGPCILLRELDAGRTPGGGQYSYSARRFRPVTDISIFHELVKKARKTGRVTVGA